MAGSKAGCSVTESRVSQGAAAEGPALSVLLIATRDPRGRATGRKTVLKTAVRSLAALGHRVTVAHFGNPEWGPLEGAGRIVALPPAGRAEFAVGAAGWVLRGRPSLNEALYTGRRAAAALEALADEEEVDIVVTDMVRTANYGRFLNRPWIADLDDLLSRRYRLLAEQGGGAAESLLGYHRAPLLRAATSLLAPVLPFVLRREANAIAVREVAVATQTDIASVVSATEAAELAARAGCPVAWTPMVVRSPATPPKSGARPRELCFVGGLDYGPNIRSLRRYDRDIRPRLIAAGVEALELHVIGHATAALTEGFSNGLVFLGYVDDLPSTLADFSAMLVPPVTPGGVKTKIIDAALSGVAVLAHVSALEGMNLTPGQNVLAWETAEELTRLLLALRAGTIDRDSLAAAAYTWAVANFGEARLRAIWAGHVATCLAAHQSGNRRTSASEISGDRVRAPVVRSEVGRCGNHGH